MLIVIDEKKRDLVLTNNGKTLFLKDLYFCPFDVFEKELVYPNYSDYNNALAFIVEYSKSEKGDVFLENGTGRLIKFDGCEISVKAEEVINDIEFSPEVQRYIPQRIKMTFKIEFWNLT